MLSLPRASSASSTCPSRSRSSGSASVRERVWQWSSKVAERPLTRTRELERESGWIAESPEANQHRIRARSAAIGATEYARRSRSDALDRREAEESRRCRAAERAGPGIGD